MKTTLKTIALGSILLVSALGSAQSRHHRKIVQANPIKIIVDGKQVIFDDTQPSSIKGRIMVPLRGIFEKIGAFVEYDAANHIVTARRGNEEVDLRLGDKIAHRNGVEIVLEVPASIVGGSTMVPLRFVTDSLGVKLLFDEPTNTVTINTNGMAFGPKGEKHDGGG